MDKQYKDIYFIGIGGIGMSAIARYYNFKGYRVSGYDKTPSDLTAALENEGMSIHYTDDISYIPSDPDSTLVIYTPAIPADMGELVHVREHGYKLIKRSKALGEIAKGQHCLAIAGTHGKTTVSTLLAHIFQNGEGCSAFLGGLSKNWRTNLLTSDNPVIVAEADEFDRSFLQLHPEIAVITAMDADHLDIYSDISHVHEAFRAFASQVTGTLIVKKGLPVSQKDTPARLLTYSFDDPSADFHAEIISKDNCGMFTYNLHYSGNVIEGCQTGVPGWVNVENSVAAASAALTYGIDPQTVKKALASFEGVWRRFDIHLNTPSLSYIDDYAHHPKEIAAALSSMRDIFEGRRITAVFQPHLYTRTRDFAPEFASALGKADKVILLDIYPAREEPIPGVTSDLIFKDIAIKEKVMLRRDELMGYLEKEPIDVLVTFGAGNIDRFIEPITELLKKRLTDE
ncbi:MAG: UDP-N-acetylmuramate--L-alanine ligase [Candidatus Cryptobacteroides sp.]